MNLMFPEELQTTERNRSTTLKLLGDPSLTSVGKYAEFPIFSVPNGIGSGVFFVVEDELIRYYVKYQTYRFLPLASMCQVGVWRDEDFAPLERDDGPSLAMHVFRTILLKKYGEVISDKIQTSYGRYFWLREINWALKHDKYVYAVLLSGEEIGRVRDIFRIKHINHWKEIKDSAFKIGIWGKTLKHERIRLLIAENPIHFPPKAEFKRQKDNLGLK